MEKREELDCLDEMDSLDDKDCLVHLDMKGKEVKTVCLALLVFQD